MLNLLLVFNLLINYENVELPSIKLTDSKNVIFKEVIVPKRIFGARKSYVEVDVLELPTIKESDLLSSNTEIIEVEYAKRQPVKRIVSGIRNLISEKRIFPRSGTYVSGNDGNPVVVEETTTTTTKKFEVKEPQIKISEQVRVPVEESEDEKRVMVYEDRRIFSGRARNRIFIRGR